VSIRVLIADDHAIFRAGLRLLINAQSDMVVVGEAEGGDRALEAARTLRPDVLLLDLSMPGGGGLPVLGAIRRDCPATRVVALSMHEDPACVRAVFDAGGIGYVFKRAADAELLTAVRMAAAGKPHLCTLCRDVVAQAALGLETHEGAGGRGAAPLSRREREVLLMVAQGYTNRQVAERLALSVKSVESYRARLLDKLGFQARVELHRYALASGILGRDGLPELQPPSR
jgi:two-component system response regulator NreC